MKKRYVPFTMKLCVALAAALALSAWLVRTICAVNLNMQLIEAADKGDLAEVKALLKRGADVKERLPDDGRTALFCASKGGYLGVVKLLLDNGADVNVKPLRG